MRNQGWIIIAGLMVMGCLCQPAHAGLYEKGGANGLGARAMGMGGAYSAVAEDETAIAWNPAGLGEMTLPRLGTSLESLYNGQMLSLNLSAAMPLAAGAAAGVHWAHDTYTQSAVLQADTMDLAGSLPLSKDKQLRMGAGLKLLFGGIPSAKESFSGVGLDLGLRYQLGLLAKQDLSLALTVQDLDTRIGWNNGVEEQIPQSVSFGSAWQADPATVAALDLELIHSGQDSIRENRLLRLGVERWFRQVIALRAGYLLDSNYANAFSLGAGIKAAGWEVQYALLGQIANLGISHRLTVSYGLQALPAAKPTPAPEPVAAAAPLPAFKLELIALPEVFSPSGANLSDTVVFTANISEGNPALVAAWRLHLSKSSGEEVREFSGASYQEQYEWDGLDRNGKTCQDGAYQAVLMLLDASGKTLATAQAAVLIRTELPNIDLRSTPVRMLLIGKTPQRPIRFRILNVGQLSNMSWMLEIRPPQGMAIKTFQGAGSIPSSVSWDGALPGHKIVAPGRYEALLSVSDAIGQVRTASQAFVVMQVEPKIEMSVTPHLLKLGDRELGKAVFTLAVQPKEGIESWKLEIADAHTKNVTKSFVGAGSPPANLVWEAKDQQGRTVKGGKYFHATLFLSYGGRNVVSGPALPLATDLGAEEASRALALHLTMVNFKPGETDIQVDEFKKIQQAAEAIRKYAKQYHLQIKGYTDARENPGQEMEISWERARKVKEYLKETCRIPEGQMEIVGYGSHLPLVPETTAAGRAKNRRVEVILIIQK